MKQIILSLLLAGLFGCTKEYTPTVAGTWKLKGVYDCTGGINVNDNNIYFQFRHNGVFVMNTSHPYANIMYDIKSMDSYLIRNDSVLFYKKDTSDSMAYHFRLENDLMLSYGYSACQFSR